MINRVTLVGNIGLIDENSYKETANGSQYFKTSVAVTEKRYNKETKESTKETTWIPIICWGSTASFCNQYVTKGCTVFVEGRLNFYEYETKDGETKKGANVNVANLNVIKYTNKKNGSDNPTPF